MHVLLDTNACLHCAGMSLQVMCRLEDGGVGKPPEGCRGPQPGVPCAGGRFVAVEDEAAYTAFQEVRLQVSQKVL